MAGIGLSLPSKLTKRPVHAYAVRRSASSSAYCRISSVKMAVSVDHKKNFPLKKSEEAFNVAKELMPGGVNSPVRAFESVGGQPIIFDSVKGSHMRDIDGNDYIDYVGSWGPAIIGHADDEVLAALAATMKKGTSFGAPCLLENQLAEMVIATVPSIEMVRFVNFGTEACMGVLRLARAYTQWRILRCFGGSWEPITPQKLECYIRYMSLYDIS
ncbi:putative glutamate-1-semialdehyde 2,1-aminomutase [Helianthus annuus]|nr:putative glutamate-1-semialdehyde 2,1-aminomutase [Helianthus annuus]